MKAGASQVTFVVGEERRLSEIVSRAEIEPLLCSLVKTGPAWAAVLDEDGLPICQQGNESPTDSCTRITHALLVEGEPQGMLVVLVDTVLVRGAEALTLLAHAALQLTVTNNLKRMLTTEMHTTIVQESYDQLVETNQRLHASEMRYRELALSLERKVEERTAELQRVYARMLQQEKLAAVGSLAAGMAHEINTPNGFVKSNLLTFRRYFERIREMLSYSQQLIAGNSMLDGLHDQIGKRRKELKIDFIVSDTEALLEQSIEGTDRIAGIVADLKSFSHLDQLCETGVDLNAELEHTLSVLSSQIEPGCLIVRDLQPVPLFACNPGLLSQALFNVLQNALQSRSDGLVVRITSRCEQKEIVLTIVDNGCGISTEQLSRVFEPFFTTREVGRGTGMGLTVAREIIRDAAGTIEVESAVSIGTTVTIRFPYEKD